MRYADLPNLRDVLPGITSRAGEVDRTGDWPATDLSVLAQIGAMRWAGPLGLGGEELSPIEMHFRYEAIASASLAVALILTQRDSAIGFIDAAENVSLREELLPQLAGNENFATVGIAQLTTSRQGGLPALRATREGEKWRVDGVIPWSTGALQSKYIVAGAVTEESQQILFALPTHLPGVAIDPPMPLVALRSTHTTSVRCQGVMLDARWLLKPPSEHALAGRKKSLPMGQAFLAMGHICGAIHCINDHNSDRARRASERLEEQFSTLRQDVLDACAPGNEQRAAEQSAAIRSRCAEMSARATSAAVALYKGSALLPEHPAQRLARETLFLLVWSCPDPVIDCTVDLLSQP